MTDQPPNEESQKPENKTAQDVSDPLTNPQPEETPEPSATAPEAVQTGADHPAETGAEQKVDSPGLAYRLFSPQTRTGRIMRPVLRWMAAITGLFALGLLSGYILLYQPAQSDLEAIAQRAAQTAQTLTERNSELQQARADRDAAQSAMKKAQADLQTIQGLNQLLATLVEVNNARAAISAKDGAAAKSALDQAQSNLAQSLPYLETVNKSQADIFKTRLELAVKELAGDPTAALADLDKLSGDLAALVKKLTAK